MKKIVLTLLVALTLCAPVYAKEQETPAFWLRQTANETTVLLSPDALQAYQKELIDGAPHTLSNLATLPWSYSMVTLRQWITDAQWPENIKFCNGQPFNNPQEKEKLLPAAAIWQSTQRQFIRYGVMTKNANLRTFPTADEYTQKVGGFDRLQETSLDLGEPVAILLEHPDRPWFYVQTYHYRGWVEKEAVASIPTRKAWLSWINPAVKRISLAPAATLTSGENLRMGASLPVLDNKTCLPRRDEKGFLTTVALSNADSNALFASPLPCTRQNIVRQALQYYDAPYVWGDSGDGVDCSGLVVRVFRGLGLALPRNADEQEEAPGWKINMAGKSTIERQQVLDKLPSGSLLHMDGHVMIYLGKSAGNYWVVHAYSGHMEPAIDGKLRFRSVMRVTISPLSLLRADGATFLDSLTTVRQWLPENYSS